MIKFFDQFDYSIDVSVRRIKHQPNNTLISIAIEDSERDRDDVLLDIKTAIQFSKELRKAIAEAKEVDNG